MPFRAATLPLLLALALLAAACGGSTTPTSPSSPGVSVPYAQTDLRVGTGAEVTAGRTAVVHYTLWLYDAGQGDNKGRRIQSLSLIHI